MRYKNNGYIGVDIKRGPYGVIRPGDLYLRSLPEPVSPESLNTIEPAGPSRLQAATLVFCTTPSQQVVYENDPVKPTPK
jgi:hypothetical protein